MLPRDCGSGRSTVRRTLDAPSYERSSEIERSVGTVVLDAGDEAHLWDHGSGCPWEIGSSDGTAGLGARRRLGQDRRAEHHGLGRREQNSFAPETLEMIHLTGKAGGHAPDCVVNDELTIHPITTAPKAGGQPAIRWLGVWFDRKLSFKRHVAERAAKARKVSSHIRSLARAVNGPPASALRKAVITCVLPSIPYGTEAWYAGTEKPPQRQHQDRTQLVSARNGWHVESVDKVLALAARGVLPVWRTTPTITLFRDAGLPSGEAAFEDAKLRFAMRLQSIDDQHPLVRRIQPPLIARGRGVGTRQRPKTKVQRLGTLLPSIPRPKLTPPPHTSPQGVGPTQLGALAKRRLHPLLSKSGGQHSHPPTPPALRSTSTQSSTLGTDAPSIKAASKLPQGSELSTTAHMSPTQKPSGLGGLSSTQSDHPRKSARAASGFASTAPQ